MAGRFAGRVVLVTGGSSGIGLALARRVAAEGAAVVLGSRREEAGEAAARAIAEDGGAPNPAGRVAGPDEVAAFVAHLLSDEARFVTGAALAIDGGSTAGV